MATILERPPVEHYKPAGRAKMPPGMTRKIAAYMIKNRLMGKTRFPTVLMLEPLHACNFHCTGCGRIREYEDTIREQMSLEECLDAVAQVDTPVVSICGGEPLIYRHIGPLVKELQRQDRYIYLCTNAWILDRKIDEFTPDQHLIFNIHLDGLEETHDLVVEWPGSFKKAIESIRLLKERGFHVCINTTLYKQTKIDEIVELFRLVEGLGVDGILLSPAYTYKVVDQEFFMQRDEIIRCFKELAPKIRGARLWNTPIYMKYLMGEMDLDCTPWGNPTRNPRGWRGPCYQISDTHHASFQNMMDSTNWQRYIKREDERCASCMTHCGYEPSAAIKAMSLGGAFQVLRGW